MKGRSLLAILLLALLILAALFVLCLKTGAPFATLTRDAIAQLNGAPHIGLLSSMGVLFWCAAASLCLFAASVGRKFMPSVTRRFLLMSGLFTCLLMLDDLFMLHELVLPEYLLIRQRYVLLVYLILTSTFLIYNFKYLVLRRPWLLALSLCFFSISVLEDAFAVAQGDVHYLVEDGAKLFGILLWFNYFLYVVHMEVTQCVYSKKA